LGLIDIKFETLGNLEYVGGSLNLQDCFNLKSLGKLKHVGSWLDLYGCENLKSLGNLEYVGGNLNLYGCENLQSLGNLEHVGGWLSLSRTPLSKKYIREEIRDMVEVVGNIFMEDDED
jgi:hypothetical protein